jgi:hypothetical protein
MAKNKKGGPDEPAISPNHRPMDHDRHTPAPGTTEPPEHQKSEDWGERQDTGKIIGRGGKNEGHVPGTQETPHKEEGKS